MSDPEHELKSVKRKRIRTARWWLRWLPRKATVHRYPGLKRFAPMARKFPEIWSFRRGPLLRAVWIGSMLTFAPLFGIQILTSVFLAILTRSNLPIMVGLMLVTNQFTAIPIYMFNYFLGNAVLGFFDGQAAHGSMTQDDLSLEGEGFFGKITGFFDSIGPTAFLAIVIGGLIIGLLFGLILHGFVWAFKTRSHHHITDLERRAEVHKRSKAAPSQSP